jgi:hypothetical protein
MLIIEVPCNVLVLGSTQNYEPTKIITLWSVQINLFRWQEGVHRANRWNFITRHNEHKRSFRNNSHTSKFAQHLNELMHSFGNIHGVMQILELQMKGLHLNTKERFHFHIEAGSNNHLNDDHTISPSRIFDTNLNKLS